MQLSWAKLLGDLYRFYSTGPWKVPVLRERKVDPFRVLVSTILSHRTRDSVTERASLRLLQKYPNAETLSKASAAQVRALIRDVGLPTSKVTGLRAAARMIVRRFGGHVPRTEEELLKLPLVGKKTAAAVRVFGFDEYAIPADVHIHRVANRLGVVSTGVPSETSAALAKVVPRRFWRELNPILVQHGQNICIALRPRCVACPIVRLCSRVGLP